MARNGDGTTIDGRGVVTLLYSGWQSIVQLRPLKSLRSAKAVDGRRKQDTIAEAAEVESDHDPMEEAKVYIGLCQVMSS